jgi:hypothetical protein
LNGLQALPMLQKTKNRSRRFDTGLATPRLKVGHRSSPVKGVIRVSINAKYLTLDNDCFFVHEQRYQMSDIESVNFCYVTTRHSTRSQFGGEVAHTGTTHDIRIKLYLKGQVNPIKLKSTANAAGAASTLGSMLCAYPLFGLVPQIAFNIAERVKKPDYGKKQAETVIEKFQQLCTTTYRQRLMRYVDALEKNGFFMYDGKKIYRNGDVVGDGWKFNFLTDRTEIHKAPFSVFHETKKKGTFFTKTIKHDIHAIADRDVFFSLLAHLYNLKWE